MRDPVIRAMFAALVDRCGGVEAVSAVMDARYSLGAKGTISKMCAGQIGITVEAVLAVEDFAQHPAITRRLAERLTPEVAVPVDLTDLFAECMAGAGRAHAEMMRGMGALSEGGTALTPDERARIAAELQQVRETVEQALAALRGGHGAGGGV